MVKPTQPLPTQPLKRLSDTTHTERCTALHGVPTMFVLELEENRKGKEDGSAYDVSTLRTGIMAGAPCPIEVMKGAIEATTAGLVLRLHSTHFANDERMGAATRTITVTGDTLHYIMHMQTTKVLELTLHLEATLRRQ